MEMECANITKRECCDRSTGKARRVSASCGRRLRLWKFPWARNWPAAIKLCLLLLATALARADELPAPVLIGPGSTNAPGPEMEAQTLHLNWLPVQRATGYRVSIRALTTDELKAHFLVPTATNLLLTLIPGEKYRWNMAAMLNTNLGAVSETLYFQIKLGVSRPRITAVSPFPVPAIDFPQVFTVYGYDILPGCQVILRHKDSGETFRDLQFVNRKYRCVSVLANFTSVPANWSVEVVDPGGYSTGQFDFPAVTPEQIPSWRWWRSGKPWAIGGFLLFSIAATGWWWTAGRRLPREVAWMRHQTEREERERLVRNLHDRASADISLLAHLADDALSEAKNLLPETQNRIRDLHSAARDAETAINDLILVADPKSQRVPQLAGHLRGRVRERLQPHGIDTSFSIAPVPLPNLAIGAAATNEVLYVCHEILNNVLKHAHATKLETKFAVEEDRFVLNFRDNGKGFHPHSLPAGRRGLTNLRARVKALGGFFDLKSAPGEGTEVTVSLPLEHDGGVDS